jgi:hypothetical protein
MSEVCDDKWLATFDDLNDDDNEEEIYDPVPGTEGQIKMAAMNGVPPSRIPSMFDNKTLRDKYFDAAKVNGEKIKATFNEGVANGTYMYFSHILVQLSNNQICFCE